MSYIIPIGNGSFVSAKNGWFCVSSAVTRDYESLGYYLWIMVGYRVPGYLTGDGQRGAAEDIGQQSNGIRGDCPRLTPRSKSQSQHGVHPKPQVGAQIQSQWTCHLQEVLRLHVQTQPDVVR